MSPLKIIFAGSGAFGLPTLQALLSSHHVIQIISQPDRPSGRGRKLTPTPISQYALDHNLPLTRPTRIADESLPPADLLVVIAYGQKIPDSIIHHPRLHAINLHASLLPKYRGAAPINHAILAGETITGNSVIRLAQKMDAGSILGQQSTPISPTETAGELHDRLSTLGPSLVLHVISELSTGTSIELPQNESLATPAPKLSRESSFLDWSQPASQISRIINGLSPWPGCRVSLLDPQGTPLTRATLLRAQALPQNPACECGVISPDHTIAAGNGSSLQILTLQPEGKRPMTLRDFQNGHPWTPGMRLQSLT